MELTQAEIGLILEAFRVVDAEHGLDAEERELALRLESDYTGDKSCFFF